MPADNGKAQPWLATAEYFVALKNWPAAEKTLRQSIETDRKNPIALSMLAWILKQQSRFAEALPVYRHTLNLEPKNPDHLFNLALCLQQDGQLEAAEESYLDLIARFPDHADALANLGRLYQDSNHSDKALKYYLRDLELRPDDSDSHFNLAFIYLLIGDFEHGWKEYEWRFQRAAANRTYPHRFKQPRWQGENFSGKTLLVHGEQGFGDNLQFLRYLPRLKARGGRVLFEVPEALASLIEGYPGIDRLQIYNPHKPCTETFDLYVPLMSLPLIFQTQLDSIPAMLPPLTASSGLIASWRQKLAGNRFKVGLVWGGHNVPDPARSCPTRELAPIFMVPGIDFYGLQTGEPAAESKSLQQFSNFKGNLGTQLKNFADTAAVIANLDLVISIDTATAHLAGAMGKPVWTLLPFAPDWRWLLERNDSPWYPSMNLFRQPEIGNWREPTTRMALKLYKLFNSRNHKLI